MNQIAGISSSRTQVSSRVGCQAAVVWRMEWAKDGLYKESVGHVRPLGRDWISGHFWYAELHGIYTRGRSGHTREEGCSVYRAGLC